MPLSITKWESRGAAAVLKQEAALEREFKTREIEQLHDAVDMRAELQRGMRELRDQVASAQAAQAQAEGSPAARGGGAAGAGWAEQEFRRGRSNSSGMRLICGPNFNSE